MEKMHFGVNFDKLTDTSFDIRFYSTENVSLRVYRTKLFYQQNKFDTLQLDYFAVNLDNNEKIISFEVPNGSPNNYCSIGFVVKDETNKKQYSVNVPVDGSIVNIRLMNYGD